jgi:hypothetical protein
MPMPRKPRGQCLACQVELPRPAWRYCSNAYQQDYQYREFIQGWLAGLKSGNVNRHGTALSKHVRRFMHERTGSRCQRCGWGERNPVTGNVPLVINHIDGDPYNTREDNLEILCPNCDALTPTWGNLNRGKGRKHRRQLYQELDTGG